MDTILEHSQDALERDVHHLCGAAGGPPGPDARCRINRFLPELIDLVRDLPGQASPAAAELLLRKRICATCEYQEADGFCILRQFGTCCLSSQLASVISAIREGGGAGPRAAVGGPSAGEQARERAAPASARQPGWRRWFVWLVAAAAAVGVLLALPGLAGISRGPAGPVWIVGDVADVRLSTQPMMVVIDERSRARPFELHYDMTSVFQGSSVLSPAHLHRGQQVRVLAEADRGRLVAKSVEILQQPAGGIGWWR